MQYNKNRSNKFKNSKNNLKEPSNPYKHSSISKEYNQTDKADTEKKNPPSSE